MSSPKPDVDALIVDGDLVDRAVVQAQADVVRRHRLLGIPLVIWRDGQVLETPADQVPIPAVRIDDSTA